MYSVSAMGPFSDLGVSQSRQTTPGQWPHSLLSNTLEKQQQQQQAQTRSEQSECRLIKELWKEWDGLQRGVSIKELPRSESTSGFCSGNWVEN